MSANPILQFLVSWIAVAGVENCVPVSVADPAALDLLKGTPFNCVDTEQAPVAAEARRREIDVVPVESLPREQLNRGVKSPVIAISDGVWPGIRVMDQATATPSSEPWIDANTWMVRSVRAWSGSRPVWLTHAPPKEAVERDCQRALAEIAAAGGHWVVPAGALARWPGLAEWARFFEEHAGWRDFPPAGALGIVQDSAGKDLTTSGEYLNLIARRGVPFRVIERPNLTAKALAGLRVLLAADLNPATPAEQAILDGFTKSGGEVIAGPKAPDPEDLSKEMIEIVGYENAGVRVYNAPSVMGYLTRSGDGRSLLLHLINYASVPGEAFKVHFKGEFGRARLYRPTEAPLDLPVERTGGKTEVSIPRFPVYAAVMLERGSDDRKQ